MAKTQHFGLNHFGAEGRLSDEGHKFTSRDRILLDAILHSIATHDHRPVSAGGGVLAGPPAGIYLELVVSTTGGTLPAGRDYYYKFSYVDANGNETEASSALLVSTPDLITPPETQNLTTATTGGSLAPGTYKYALAFYQAAGGVTTAPNLSSISIPFGTGTNTVTIPLPTLPDDADGWKIYRKGPGDLEYWLLDTVAAGPLEYVDDGSISPDCTQKRPLANSTNSTNSVTIDLPPSELPLDTRIVAWRIYRTQTPGAYPVNSLVATVVETTTEGGADLVTTYVDEGSALSLGVPLGQTAIPPSPPQLDAGDIFDLLGGRLPAVLAPLGVRAFNMLLPGTLAVKDYHQFVPPHDMLVERLDAFFLTAPTGLTAATNFITVRVSDNASENAVQKIWTDAETADEIQAIYNTATSGTFTLSDGVDTTAAIPFDALAADIETRLEADITSIVDVTVSGSGRINDPWVVTFVNPAATNLVQLTAVDTLVGGSTFITTVRDGSNGGTFTIGDGTTTTAAIAFNALAATVETRLEADLASIIDVTVTGAGTVADPWVITFLNPGGQPVPLLIVFDDIALNGNAFVEEVTRGFGPTQVDLVIDQNQAGHFWQSPTTDFGTQEAETAPATGGTQVSDQVALNDVAMELDTQNEENYWNVGVLEAGEYVARFWIADPDVSASFDIEVVDDHLGVPVLMESRSIAPERPVYTPAYEVYFTSTGVEDIFLVTTKTDAGVGRVRVDKYAYEAVLPVLHGGSNVTVEVLVTGAPTTNGADLQISLWH